MDHDGVLAWVADYERAWREGNVYAVERLFSPGVRYHRSPYEPVDVGHDGVKAFWLEDDGQTFSMEARVVALEAETAVVRVLVNYLAPTRQDYTDLWVLRFADDGRVEDFDEWACWPGKPYSATST
ncbi:nuclear transport factor 2 family protein [Lapillicoccus sp.]|uniref:nuclear transport factor 2 family protein n=1 Tax=Lapillicoccus sp. TaxID=1909287 RepID=UPI0025E30C41|nr:nuclear transport factor 2 family protein [Lapillicoccus sp.]